MKKTIAGKLLVFVLILILFSPVAFAITQYIVGCAVGAVAGFFMATFMSMGVNCYDYNPDNTYTCSLCNNFNEFGLNSDTTPYFEPCTQYRCESLGPQCQFAANDNGVGVCVRKDCSNELNPPEINGCLVRHPEDRSDFSITSTSNGCKINDPIPAFSGAAIMLNISEPAQCKFSLNPDFDFTDQDVLWFGDPNYEEQHFFLLSLYGVNQTLVDQCNSGNCNLYVKCEDVCHNVMRNSYAISFDVEDRPDLQPPEIVSTIVPSGSSIPAGINGINFSMNVFDHSSVESCKWTKDQFEDYDDIENNFACLSDLTVGNNFANYLEEGIYCETTLTGLEDDTDNVFYLTCRDDSDQKNVLKPYVEFTLKGTTPLNITDYDLPSGTVYDLEQSFSVTTSRDADCYYIINNGEWDKFNNTGGTSHDSEVEFSVGQVDLEILCYDDAGNEDSVTASFNVAEDLIAPKLEQLYSDLSYLTIVLDEKAICEYSDEQFIFGDGVPMVPNDYALKHQAAIGQDVYYIKCDDRFNNELSLVVYP